MTIRYQILKNDSGEHEIWASMTTWSISLTLCHSTAMFQSLAVSRRKSSGCLSSQSRADLMSWHVVSVGPSGLGIRSVAERVSGLQAARSRKRSSGPRGHRQVRESTAVAASS